MRLCLSCYRLSPGGSLYCGNCGRSFGGRLCPARHISPVTSAFCVQCGSQQLTAPTWYLPLGWMSRLILLACVSFIGRWLWLNRSLVGQALASGFTWGLIHLLNLQPRAAGQMIACDARIALNWLILFVIALALVPGKVGKKVRRLVFRLLRWLWRLPFRLFGGK